VVGLATKFLTATPPLNSDGGVCLLDEYLTARMTTALEGDYPFVRFGVFGDLMNAVRD